MELLEGMTFDPDIYKAEMQEAAGVLGLVLDEEELEEMANEKPWYVSSDVNPYTHWRSSETSTG